jgi:hypothetical protein
VEKTEQGVGRVWRRFLIAAKWTVGVLVVLSLLFVGINWFDEDLSPEARALLIAPPNPYASEENLYLALLGFDAKEGASPITAGLAKIAIYEREIAAFRKDPQHVLRIFPDAPWQNKEKLEFQGKVDFCLPLTKSCLVSVETHKREIDQLLKANLELYRRYSSLHGLKGYYETATPSIYLISPYAPSPIRQLYLVNIALRTQSGVRAQRNAAIADLLADIRTWRLELTGSGSLISKMLAVAHLQGDYALLADIIADGRLDLADASPEIQSTLELSEDDWKIGKIVAFEYRISDFMWDELRVTKGKRLLLDTASEESWWDRSFDRISSLFIKINATQNLQARFATQQQKMADADPAKFFIARDAYHLWLRDNLEFRMHYIYNPFGKILIDIATSPYENYYLRAFDGAAFQRLVRLGYEIRSRKIEDKAVPLFIQNHPEWASHPVDGRPFIWDERKREIAVQTLGQQPKDRRFSIRVWSAALRK